MRQLFLLLALLLVTSIVEANTYWVQSTGTAGGACPSSTTQPATSAGFKNTINGALACVVAAGGAPHTINVKTGAYGESISAASAISGTSAINRIFLTAVDGAHTVSMSGCSGDGVIGLSAPTGRQFWTVDGIDINGTNCGTGISAGYNNIFKNLTIYDLGKTICPNATLCGVGHPFSNTIGAGIGIYAGYSGNLFQNVIVRDTTTGASDQGGGNCCQGPHGAYVEGDTNTFDNVQFFNVGQNGIQFYHFSDITTAHDNIVQNSTIHDTGKSAATGKFPYASCVAANGPNNIVRNTVCYNSGAGISAVSGGQIINNTFYNVSADGITDGGAANTGTIRNNLFASVSTPMNINASPAIVRDHNHCSSAGTNCASTGNPLFTNAAGGVFSLLSGSPGINVGINTLCPATDFAGNPRPSPVGGLCDTGAYEFQFGAAPTATVTWTCDRCSPTSGVASGTTNWTIGAPPPLNYAVGVNNVIVTATDSTGVSTTDTITVTYAPTFPGNTLAGAWPFEGTLGTTPINVADYTINKNDGTLINNAARVAQGKFDQAVSLDGVNQSVNVPDANSLDFTQSFTFSAWVFPINSPTTFVSVMVKNHPVGSIGLFSSTQSICPAGAGVPAMVLRVNGAFYRQVSEFFACGTKPLPPNQWTHLAGTYDGPGLGSNLRLYVNGVLVTTTSATGYIEPSSPPAVSNLQIGASQYGEYFTGRISDPRVRNYAVLPSGTVNTTPGAACLVAAWNENNNVATASVIGDMNCPIILTVTPPVINFPASATALKLSATAGALKLPVQ